MLPILTKVEILVILTRAYFQLRSGLRARLDDIFIVLTWSLVSSVPQVFVREGALNVTELARAFRDPERGSSMRIPQMDEWDALALRFNAEYLLQLLGRM